MNAATRVLNISTSGSQDCYAHFRNERFWSNKANFKIERLTVEMSADLQSCVGHRDIVLELEPADSNRPDAVNLTVGCPASEIKHLNISVNGAMIEAVLTNRADQSRSDVFFVLPKTDGPKVCVRCQFEAPINRMELSKSLDFESKLWLSDFLVSDGNVQHAELGLSLPAKNTVVKVTPELSLAANRVKVRMSDVRPCEPLVYSAVIKS